MRVVAQNAGQWERFEFKISDRKYTQKPVTVRRQLLAVAPLLLLQMRATMQPCAPPPPNSRSI